LQDHFYSGVRKAAKFVRIDPVKQVQGLAFTRHLKTPRLFSEALEDAAAFDSVDFEAAPRDDSQDIRRSQLERARARLDIVAMMMDRREFAAWMEDDALDAITIYSDASPVVGTELQGMLIDYIVGEEVFRKVLPGSILTYGRSTWQNKAIALVWAVFFDSRFFVGAVVLFFRQGAVHYYRLWRGDSDHGYL